MVHLFPRKTWRFFLHVCVALFSAAAMAQPGALDPSFGFGGKVSIPLDIHQAEACSVVAQEDGKVLVAGNANGDFALARLQADGQMDTGFGVAGIVVTDFAQGIDSCAGIVLQQDGKILMAGSSRPRGRESESHVALARYLANGIPDTTFGSNGRMILDLTGKLAVYVSAAVAQADGKLLLAGVSVPNLELGEAMLLRVNADGTLDTSFNNGGVFIRFDGYYSTAQALAVQKDGRIVIAGYLNQEGPEDIVLARFTANGALDPEFNARGYVVTSILQYDQARAVALQDDGRIVVTGWSGNLEADGMTRMTVLRYLPNGNLDNGFNHNGRLVIDTPSRQALSNQAVVQRNGKITIAGGSTLYGSSTSSNFTLLRFMADGTPDLDFGVNGMAITDFNGSSDEAKDMKLLPDGKLLVMGQTFTSAKTNAGALGVARYDADAPSGGSLALYAGAGIEGARMNHQDAFVMDTGNTGPSVSQTFTILNRGDRPLEGLFVELDPDAKQPSGFSINTSGITRTLAAGKTMSFVVQHFPTVAAPMTMKVFVFSNDQELKGVPFEISLGIQPATVTMDAVKAAYFENEKVSATSGGRAQGGGGVAVTKITIPVRLSAPAATVITVPVYYSGDAIPGKDYTGAVSKLTFAAGQTVRNIELVLVADNIPEPNKAVRIELGPPLTAAAVLGNRAGCSFTIIDEDLKVVIEGEPFGQMMSVGDSFDYGYSVTGSAPLTFVWKQNGVPVPGGTSMNLSLRNVGLKDAGSYVLTAANRVNAATSAVIQIAVVDTAPKTVFAARGAPATFSVAALGPGLTYQWKRNGNEISNATNKTYILTNAQPADMESTFTCTVTLPGSGYLTTQAMRVIVATEPASLILPDGGNLPHGMVGVFYQYQIVATPGMERTPSSYKVEGLPSGLTFDPLTGRIFGTPGDRTAGPYRVTLTPWSSAGGHSYPVVLVIEALPATVAGTYVGAVAPHPGINGNLGGRFDMVVTPGGRASGKFTLGANVYPFAGMTLASSASYAGDGLRLEANFVLERKGASSLTVRMTFDPASNSLASASLLENNISNVNSLAASFSGLRVVWNASYTPVAYKGYHTQYWRQSAGLSADFQITPGPLPPAGEPSPKGRDANLPRGYGYGSINVNETTGNTNFVGKLADGTAYTVSVPISELGFLPVYQCLYTPVNQGSICGFVAISSPDHQVVGSVDWRRGANPAPGVREYPAGFFTAIDAVGAFYTPPVSPAVALDPPAGPLNARVEFHDPDDAGEFMNVTIGEFSRVTIPPEVKSNSLGISSTTGLFTGIYLAQPDPTNAANSVTRLSVYGGIIVYEKNAPHPIGRGAFMMERVPRSPGEFRGNTLIESNAVELLGNWP